MSGAAGDPVVRAMLRCATKKELISSIIIQQIYKSTVFNNRNRSCKSQVILTEMVRVKLISLHITPGFTGGNKFFCKSAFYLKRSLPHSVFSFPNY